MQFQTLNNGVVSIDPFSQSSIDAAKAVAPGQGIGPAVASVLMAKIAAGEVTNADQLPAEYRPLFGGFGSGQ
jgi:hypothetical protein